MKIIESEVITKKTQFKAKNGIVFDTKEDCIKYETDLIKSEWNNINKKIISSIAIGLPYATDESDVYILCPQNSKEIELINDYIQIETEDDYPDFLDSNDINQVIVLDFEAEHFTCYKINLKEHLQKLQKTGKKYLNYFLEEQNSKVSISFKEALKIADIKSNEWISIIQENEIENKYPNYILHICAKDIGIYFDTNKIQVIKIYPVFLDEKYEGIRFVIKNHESFDSAYFQFYGR